jgi:hypothetical protein
MRTGKLVPKELKTRASRKPVALPAPPWKRWQSGTASSARSVSPRRARHTDTEKDAFIHMAGIGRTRGDRL